MKATKQTMLPLLSFSPFLFLFLTLTTGASSSLAASDTFIYGGCSRVKYKPNSPYEINLNSLLTSLVNSAMYSPFNKFTTGSQSSQTSNNVVYGLYQCRGDLSKNDCSACVQHALSQLGILCIDSCGGTLQLDGCLIKYDNATFLGVEDKTMVNKKCGPQLGGYNSDELTRRDQVLSYMLASGSGTGLFRTGESGSTRGVAQCVGDMSGAQCQDCLTEAIGRLKNECGLASWGDMFLAKCYVRYTNGGYRSHEDFHGSSQDDEIEKTLAILIGLIAGVALIIIFIAFLRKLCEGKGVK